MAYRSRNDERWTMDFISEGCRSLTGYSPQEIIGNSLIGYNDLIHPEDRKLVTEEIRKAIEGKNQFHVEYRLIARDGTVRWLWENRDVRYTARQGQWSDWKASSPMFQCEKGPGER